jgi:hypothetical protein
MGLPRRAAHPLADDVLAAAKHFQRATSDYVFASPKLGDQMSGFTKMVMRCSSDTIARVLDEAQQRQHVLDVGGVEKLPPNFEQNVPARQLNLSASAARRERLTMTGVSRGSQDVRVVVRLRRALVEEIAVCASI